MEESSFDATLIGAFFALLAEEGWQGATVVAAARRAGLSLEVARRRFRGRLTVLSRFASLADQAALAAPPAEGSVRDKLFDLLMQRIDVFQRHRAGVEALMRHLPRDPRVALFVATASLRSMAWMLETAGVPAAGPLGRLRRKGLLGVWLWTLRAWRHDDSEDLSATMAALDQALTRAASAAEWLAHRPAARE